MIRTCSSEDEFIGDGDMRCGLTFDDVDHSTICPHPLVNPPMAPYDLFIFAAQGAQVMKELEGIDLGG